MNADFKKVVAAMKAKCFNWGGDWVSFKDYPHFELYNVVDGEKIKPYNPSTKENPSPAPSGGVIGTVRVKATGLNIRKVQEQAIAILEGHLKVDSTM